jgi:hypothetical protein
LLDPIKWPELAVLKLQNDMGPVKLEAWSEKFLKQPAGGHIGGGYPFEKDKGRY